MTAVEGIVEDVQARQIGPGNVPGPLEPTVVPVVEAARQLRKELRECYRGVTFSVKSNKAWYPCLYVEYTDGPPEADVQATADDYVGYRHVEPPREKRGRRRAGRAARAGCTRTHALDGPRPVVLPWVR